MTIGDWVAIGGLSIPFLGGLVRVGALLFDLNSSVKGLTKAVQEASETLKNLGEKVKDQEVRLSVLEAKTE